MEHLNMNDLLDFVTMVSPSPEELDQSKKINAHMAVCEPCRARVRAALSVYEALLAEGKQALSAKRALKKKLEQDGAQ